MSDQDLDGRFKPRMARRVRVNFHAALDGESTGDEQGRVIEISKNGMAMLIQRDLGLGYVGVFSLQPTEGHDPLTVRGKVVNSVPVNDAICEDHGLEETTGFKIGIQFVDVSPDQERALFKLIHDSRVFTKFFRKKIVLDE